MFSVAFLFVERKRIALHPTFRCCRFTILFAPELSQRFGRILFYGGENRGFENKGKWRYNLEDGRKVTLKFATFLGECFCFSLKDVESRRDSYIWTYIEGQFFNRKCILYIHTCFTSIVKIVSFINLLFRVVWYWSYKNVYNFNFGSWRKLDTYEKLEKYVQ